MTFTSCSQEAGLAVDDNTDVAKKINNTTSLIASRGGSDSNAAKTRTVTTIDEWEVAWNDGSHIMFDADQSKTGLNPNIDYIEFLQTDGKDDWLFLTDPKGRQVFKWEKKVTGPAGSVDGSWAQFTLSQKPNSSETYEGLDPDTEYYGYYFQPFIKDKKLPVVAKTCPSTIVSAMKKDGYDTDEMTIGNIHLSGQDDAYIQSWLAEHDYLQAYPAANPTKTTIKPVRDGRYDEATNSYLFDDEAHAIHMKHTMALVEFDIVHVISGARGTRLPLNYLKLVAMNNLNPVTVFDNMAAVDAHAAWEFLSEDVSQGDASTDTGEVDSLGNHIIIGGSQNDGVERKSLLGCARTDIENTKPRNAPIVYPAESTANVPECLKGRRCTKFFFLIRQYQPCEDLYIELCTGGSYAGVHFFHPSGQLLFEPGKYYRFVLESNTKTASTQTLYQTTATLDGLYPFKGQKNPKGQDVWDQYRGDVYP